MGIIRSIGRLAGKAAKASQKVSKENVAAQAVRVREAGAAALQRFKEGIEEGKNS